MKLEDYMLIKEIIETEVEIIDLKAIKYFIDERIKKLDEDKEKTKEKRK